MTMLPDIIERLEKAKPDPTGLIKDMLKRLVVSHRANNLYELHEALPGIPAHIWKKYGVKYNQYDSSSYIMPNASPDNIEMNSCVRSILGDIGLKVKNGVDSSKMTFAFSSFVDAYSKLEILDDISPHATQKELKIISEIQSETYETLKRLFNTTFYTNII